jgi:two-component system, response regulator YesN
MALKSLGRSEAQRLSMALRTDTADAPDTPGADNDFPSRALPLESRLHARELSSKKLHDLKMRFERQLQEGFSGVDGAQALHCSESYFSRQFSAEFGEHFSRYKMRYRIERAQELLSIPSVAIADVASVVGFTDPSYFSRVFRDFTGMTPSQYRDRDRLPSQPAPSQDVAPWDEGPARHGPTGTTA